MREVFEEGGFTDFKKLYDHGRRICLKVSDVSNIDNPETKTKISTFKVSCAYKKQGAQSNERDLYIAKKLDHPKSFFAYVGMSEKFKGDVFKTDHNDLSLTDKAKQYLTKGATKFIESVTKKSSNKADELTRINHSFFDLKESVCFLSRQYNEQVVKDSKIFDGLIICLQVGEKGWFDNHKTVYTDLDLCGLQDTTLSSMLVKPDILCGNTDHTSDL